MAHSVPLKVMIVVGTRPEAIKMAPVVRELTRHAPAISTFVCASGQHRDLLGGAFDALDLRPDLNLEVMVHDQSLAGLTSRLFERLDRVILEQQPDWLFVQGDTTTAMVGAVAAFYHHVRVGHVEAGLRTNDLRHPFPEELNRRIADQCADLCFAPTMWARENLVKEGVPASKIYVTGNTIVDAVMEIASRPYDESSGPLATIPRARRETEGGGGLGSEDAASARPRQTTRDADHRWGPPSGEQGGRTQGPDRAIRWVLVTAHRRESFGAPLERICVAVQQIAGMFRPDVHLIVPVHPNPRVTQTVRRMLTAPNCSVVPPLDYVDLIFALRRASLVLTDSGGIQEEAPTFGVPVLVLRAKTERPEGIYAGVAQLVGTDTDRIVAEASKILSSDAACTPIANPYGDGAAARRIVAILGRTAGLDPNDAVEGRSAGLAEFGS